MLTGKKERGRGKRIMVHKLTYSHSHLLVVINFLFVSNEIGDSEGTYFSLSFPIE